ncbi:MAG: hypothetical protein RLZZ511_1003 [Cyanobacteriota bacterium]|jgi:hypothetical protein
MEFATIGFLSMHRFEDGTATRGGILVTDTEMKPLEFRVTAPVRPQKFQEMIYGDILDEHMSVDLMGLPLLAALEQKPDLIIVRDFLFLGLNSRQETPTILLLKEDESPMKKGISSKSLNSQDSGRPPVKICTSGKSDSALGKIVEQLNNNIITRDLMEPFSRLEKACADLHARKVGDS